MSNPREIANETARSLRQMGMDGARAEKVGQEIARHVDRKQNGLPVPERFRPIEDSRKRR